MNSYYFSKIVQSDFDSTILRVTEVLSEFGFGVMTDIDVRTTLKKKLDVDFRNYRILGACHPPSAFKALSVEDKIGTMLPCNVIVQEHLDGTVEISSVDPIASMMAINNPQLGDIALNIREKLKQVIELI